MNLDSISALVLALGLAGTACSDRIKIGQELPLTSEGGGGATSQGTPGGSSTSGGAAPSGGEATCQITACQGKVYRCGNCIDDDADGVTDSADAECTGPCDDTEDSYFGGIPGQNNAPCHADCYFDQDTGQGNDQCYWSQNCDPLSVAPSYPPSGDKRCAYDPAAKIPGTSASCDELGATQSATCATYCGPLTPNGCDSFGCCELPADSGKFVWIGSTVGNVGSCTRETVADPASCQPCTPVPSAFNACDPCEVCVGRTAPAASCTATGNRCPPGDRACGLPGELACDLGQYCVTGCCEAAPK